MVTPSDHAYTYDHVLNDNGTLSFACDTNVAHWPWHTLPPHHPIVVQSINFWASVESGAARGTFDPKKWSALTFTEWSFGGPSVGHAVRGEADAPPGDGTPGYGMRFYDRDGALVLRMTGTGVVFHTRNFEGWRHDTKQTHASPTDMSDFGYAPADDLGVATALERFLSPLSSDAEITAEALITKANGLPPAHPHIGGSGDHVNSTHLAECGRQFISLLLEGQAFQIIGGDMRFDRYVELGRPFRIIRKNGGESEQTVSMRVAQAGRPCASLNFKFARR